MTLSAADRRLRGRGPPFRAAALLLVLAVLLLSGTPLGFFSASSVAASPHVSSSATGAKSPPQPPPVTETVTAQNQTIGDLSDFWGVGVNPAVTLANSTSETQPTPINWYTWPAGAFADTVNITSGTLWTEGYPTQEATNESQFVTWCKSVSCHAIISLPGEIDSPATGAYDVAYTEQTLGFYPDYWEIGNEPYLWLHFGENWSSWQATDYSTVSPMEYAFEVQAYVSAIRAVAPNASIIGLPGVGHGSSPDGVWINATVAVNGPNITAVAIHDYPAEAPATGTLAKFFQTLTNKGSNMTNRILTDEQEVKAACSSCSIKFLVDEFGAGTGVLGAYQPYMHTYPEVPYITAELLIMTESNVSNADVFALRSAYNGSLFNAQGLPLPLDSLYTQILPHYDPLPLETTISAAHGAPKVFAGVSENPQSNSLTLLAVNTNTVTSVQLSVAGPIFPRSGSYSIWQANNSTNPVNGTFSHSFGFETTPSWLIPPMGVILVSVCHSNASLSSGGQYPLTFCESGLPTGTPWSVTIGTGLPTYSFTQTITLMESPGAYAYTIGTIAGWRIGNSSGSVTVASGPSSVQLPWAAVTFPVNFSESGLPNGTRWSVWLGDQWFDSNSSYFTVYEPNGTYNYTFGIVGGWTTTPRTGWVYVDVTPVQVTTTWTQVTYSVQFHETGLPARTPWSVNVSGTAGYSTTTTLFVQEPNGTYLYTVGSVPGYTPNTYGGEVVVRNTVAYVPLTWTKNASVYSVRFNETGLGAGTVWNVSLNGTVQRTNTSAITFYVGNGTLNYSLGEGAGWAPSSYLGSVTVTGAPATVNISYTRITYLVTFNETGLPYPRPSGNWSVTVNGTTYLASTNPVLTTPEPNGTYPYKVGPESGYTTSWQGTFTVNGSAVEVLVPFTPTLFYVGFNSTGLSGAESYRLNVTGYESKVCYNGNLCPYSLTNGTYSYNATPSIKGWGIYPLNQTFTVNGHSVALLLNFSLFFPVTFNEIGLSSPFNWTVSLNGSGVLATSPSIAFAAPNGTYNFSVQGIPGLVATPDQGRITVAGSSVSQTILFAVATVPINFTESGLPSGTNWSVVFNQTLYYSNRAIISIPVANGTDPYRIDSVAGYRPSPRTGDVVVDGTAFSVPVTFTVYEQVLPVNFTETGLSAGTNWSVLLNGSLSYSTGTTVSFMEPNGSYIFQIVPHTWFTASPTGGQITVDGTGTSTEVTWTHVIPVFNVTFTSTGLASGTNWSVTLGNQTRSSDGGTTVTFSERNGTYDYQVGAVQDYSLANPSASVVVAGEPVEVQLDWKLSTYAVTFTETGLPTGMNWSVRIEGTAHFSNGTGTVTVPEPNGSYPYTFGIVPGYAPSFLGGTVTVAGADQNVEVSFSRVTYPVTFTETGLPSGTEWSVALSGSAPQSSGSSEIDFEEPNGTYTYTVSGISGWTTLYYRGIVTLPGQSAFTVAWVRVLYAVTVSETGLPSGSTWSVNLNGSVVKGTTTSLAFKEPNGTYSFTVQLPSGYGSNVSAGSVHVDGTSVKVPLLVTANPAGGSGGMLSRTDEQLLAVGAVVVMVGLVMVFWLRSRKGPDAPPPVPPTAI